MENNSVTMSNSSAISDRNITLEELNYERMMFQLPVVIMLTVIMVAGLVGNVVVIYVYVNKKKTPASFFILLLASGDLTSCVFCIPFEMFDLSNPYQHPVPVLCKIIRFLEVIVFLWGGFILTSITFERYFKICHPLKRFTLKKANRLSLVIFTATVCISWPQLFLQGSRTVETRIEGVYGKDCSMTDEMFGSIYSFIFQLVMVLCYTVGIIVFVTFYGKIIHVVLKRKKQTIGETYSFIPTVSSSVSRSQVQCDSQIEREHESDGGSFKASQTQDKNRAVVSPQISKVNVNSRISNKVRIRTYRTTRIFAVVTTAGVVSYMPYLIVEALRQVGVAFKAHTMSTAEDLMFEFLIKSYYLNNIVNPIIYSAMNPQFRKDVNQGMKRVFKCLKL